MRIAFLKPDFGVTGGLEAVVERLEAVARADGHDVHRLTVDQHPPRAEVAGLPIPGEVWHAAPEYFRYLHGIDAFARVDVRRYDLVVSTQPPSFVVDHPHHLALFYHHHRVYYDLEELYLRAGFAPDEAVHRAAGRHIRELDQPHLERVSWFLAGSATVAERLRAFNDIDRSSVFWAGLIVGRDEQRPAPSGDGAVLCVGRHEFPKRTELVVAAAHLLPHRHMVLVGTGGREAWARNLDRRLATGEVEVDELSDTDLWCNTGTVSGPAPEPRADANLTFAGRVDDDELATLYAAAPCVVAPAYDEDYGLTAIEAMAQAKPVVVCNDGGGLTELVEHERTGLVVEPTPAAIAAAVERLCEDRDLAAQLGANARDRAAELSWTAAADQFRDGIERVRS